MHAHWHNTWLQEQVHISMIGITPEYPMHPTVFELGLVLRLGLGLA